MKAVANRKVKATPTTKPTPEPHEGHLIGYARVSMADQNPQLQIDALKAAGVDERDIYWEHGSGTGTAKRREFKALMKDIRAGDVALVWKLDRLGRNASQLYETSRRIQEVGAHLRVLTTPGLDTTTPMGRAMFGMLAVFAEFEAGIGKERTVAGLRRAASEGRHGGARPKHPDEAVLEAVKLGTAAGARSLSMSKAGFLKAIARIRGGKENGDD